jgi:hypothetical protein
MARFEQGRPATGTLEGRSIGVWIGRSTGSAEAAAVVGLLLDKQPGHDHRTAVLQPAGRTELSPISSSASRGRPSLRSRATS